MLFLKGVSRGRHLFPVQFILISFQDQEKLMSDERQEKTVGKMEIDFLQCRGAKGTVCMRSELIFTKKM